MPTHLPRQEVLDTRHLNGLRARFLLFIMQLSLSPSVATKRHGIYRSQEVLQDHLVLYIDDRHIVGSAYVLAWDIGRGDLADTRMLYRGIDVDQGFNSHKTGTYTV